MESVPLQKIREKAEEYDSHLLCTDPRFRRSVTLIHEEGTYLHYQSAFLMRIEKEWIACFTEHHGVLIYHETDLSGYWEMKRSYDPLEELP